MTRRATAVATNLLWLPAIAVAGLQMFDARGGIVTSYGADVFGPIALYASFRTGGTVLAWLRRTAPSPAVSAFIVLGGCVAWELCQLGDFTGTPLFITAGTFDPWDLVAYVLGVTIAMGGERLQSLREAGNRGEPRGEAARQRG